MIRYALSSLAARKAGVVATFLALACAAALVTACGALLETGLRGEIDTERYAGAPVVVAGDQDVHHEERKGGETKHKAKPVSERAWVPADTVERIEEALGVRQAIPEVEFPAEVVVPGTGSFAVVPDDGPSLGHAWDSAALTPFTLDEGRSPEADDEIVLDRRLVAQAGLAVGDDVTVQATGTPTVYELVGIASTPSTATGGLEQQITVFFSSGQAERLAGHPDRYSVIAVFPEDGVSVEELELSVDEALAGTTLEVHTDDLGAVEFLDAAKARVELISMGGALGGTGLLVAALVVVGTLALSIRQRRRELALLRAVGATPRQVRRLIGREAVLVGAAASLLGAATGLLLAGWLYDRFVALGTIPRTLGMVRGPLPALAGVGATTVAAWLAARISSRRTARIRPAEALLEASIESRRLPMVRLFAGVLVLAAGAVLLAVLTGLRTEPTAMPVTYLVVLVLAIGLSLLGPLVARGALALLAVPLRASPVAGHLAAHNSRAEAARLAGAIVPLALLVGLGCTILFVPTTLAGAAEQQTGEGITADWVIGSAGPGVPGDAAAALRDEPGVTAVTELVHTTVRSPGLAEYSVQGVTPRGLGSTLDLGVTEGSLDELGDDGVAVSDVVSDSKELHPGDEMDLVMGDHTSVSLTVIAVYERGLGFGDLTMTYDLVAAHVDNPLSDSVLVAADAGTGEHELAAAVDEYPGVGVTDSEHVAGQQAEARRQDLAAGYVGLGLVLAFTAIAAVNTLAMSTADRSSELALLRLVGTTRRQVLHMLRLESVITALAAVLLGTVISLLTLTSFAAGMADGAAPSVPLPVYLLVVATAFSLALLATLVPGRIALREHMTEAMGSPR